MIREKKKQKNDKKRELVRKVHNKTGATKTNNNSNHDDDLSLHASLLCTRNWSLCCRVMEEACHGITIIIIGSSSSSLCQRSLTSMKESERGRRSKEVLIQ